MSKSLENTTVSNIVISDTGITVTALSVYVIPAQDYDLWAASDDVVVHLGTGDLIANNGSTDLAASEGIRLLQGGQSNKIQMNDSLLDTDRIKVLVNYDSTTVDHGLITGLADDDHTQYHNDARGDARYFTETEHIDTSAGAGDAGKPVKLDAAGHIDATMVNDADIDHTNIGSIGTNTHAQIDTHIADITNPHAVTKTQVGLSNVPNTDATARANHTGTQLASTISDFDTEVSNNASVAANTAKVTNATHTSEVTGSTALTVDKVAISNKTLVTAATTDEILIGDASDTGNLKKVTAQTIADLGSGTSDHTALSNIGTNTHAQIDTHIASVANPHVVTKAQVGLGNVNNTSDVNKPVSTAQAAANTTDRARANHTGTQLASTISNFQTTVSANSNVTANTAKVTNATHTSEVTGATALTVNKIAISNKTLVTAAATDEILIGDASDTGNLKKVTAQSIANLGSGTSDHGALTGLADDDHTQYHNDARGDARYYTETELDAGQLDNRYFTETEHISTSAGAGDAGKPVKLDAAGHIDATMVNDADIDHTNIGSIGTNTHAQIDTHIADATIHFTEASIDHTAISNIGTNTHAQIDTHIADVSNPHSVDINDVTPTTTKGDLLVENATVATRLAVGTDTHVLTADSAELTGVKWATPTTGVTDHGALTGLADDDHTQYLNETRHDALAADNPHSVTIDQVTPTTTKGDIIVENATVATRLAVGTNDQVLTADSAEATGVKWATPAAGSDPNATILSVVSNTGTITKGQVVENFGYDATANVIKVKITDSDTEQTSEAFGIAKESITTTVPGEIVTQGVLSNIDTSAFTAGAELYVSGTAGALTATKPAKFIHKVAICIESHVTTGSIYVFGHTGYSKVVIQDEGTTVSAAPYRVLNFTGAGVTATDNGTSQHCNIDIPGSGGGGVISRAVYTTTSTTENLNTTTLTAKNFFTTEVENTGTDFSKFTSTLINIDFTGRCKITVQCDLLGDGTKDLSVIFAALVAATEVMAGNIYFRGFSGNNRAGATVLTWIGDVTSSGTIQIDTIREGAAGDVFADSSASIMTILERLT